MSLKSLPPHLVRLNVSENYFTGDFCLQNPSKPLCSFWARLNELNAKAVVLKETFVDLTFSGTRVNFDEEGNLHPDVREML